jgi:hypothetical protein
VRRNPRARDHDQERDQVIARCGHRPDPVTLAVTPQPHTAGPHSRLPGDDRHGGP